MGYKKYKILSEDVVQNLINFLDEIQFDASKENTTDDMHKVNFCTWAINELLNSYNVISPSNHRKSKDDPQEPKKKTRDDYVDETFMDWNLPEMSDDEYKKLVDQFDNFLRAWEKEYYKKNSKTKSKKKSKEDNWKPRIEDIAEHCSLDEIEEMLKDDPELTPQERFDLYYEEYERVQRDKIPKYTLDQIMKKIGITSYKEPPKK